MSKKPTASVARHFLDVLGATNAGIVIEAEDRGKIPTSMATSPRA
jgi:hypothetical protein